jgi:hypothetical protein
MNNLIFYSSSNSPGKHDATGAFEPEAKAFLAINKGRLIPNDCIESLKVTRRLRIWNALRDEIDIDSDVDSISFFCHGWETGIQMGFSLSSIETLVSNLTVCCKPDLRVNLYCCSTADGPDIGDENYPDDDETGTDAPGTDGGFADKLRDALCRNGLVNCRVMAHRTAGHCCKNPAVVLFEGDGTTEGRDGYKGGKWIVDPKDDLWPAWRAALKTDFRFRFPFMTMEEIEKELRGEI